MSRNNTCRAVLGLSAAFVVLASQSGAATWTPVKNLPPNSAPIGHMLLLTDGSIMAQDYTNGSCSAKWYRLQPDSTGSYVNGTWSALASMSTGRLFFASVMLPSGKVFVLGGEYSGSSCSANDNNTGEIYDPVANTWSPIATFPQSQFGDDMAILLNDGNILASYLAGRETYLYTPGTNSWTFASEKFNNDVSDEEGWTKLADGKILTYDIFQTLAVGGSNKGYAELSNALGSAWADISPDDGSANGAIPALSSVALGYELGPQLRLQDGRVLVIGATNNTALYNETTNTWAAGPTIVGNLNGTNAAFGADDAPAAILPNGHVIFAADAGPNPVTSTGNTTNGSHTVTNIPHATIALLQQYWAVAQQDGGTGVIPSGTYIYSIDNVNNTVTLFDGCCNYVNATGTVTGEGLVFGGIFSNPTQLFDFNPAGNSGAGSISPVSPALSTNYLTNDGSFLSRMLMLPTGQLLFSDGSNQLNIYTPDGTASPAYKPVINGIAYSGTTGVFTLTGKQLNGQSAGSAYGDDVMNDSNYPIVRLTSTTGTVYYARTTNWSNYGVATGATAETVTFTVPAGITAGNYSVLVSGAGIQSSPVALNITSSELTPP